METIKNYLDNLFAGYPKTPEVENAKSELLNSMEDKYTELKRQGKSENEAIGIVISEFGNIDELMKEMNVTPVNGNRDDVVSVSREEVDEIIDAKKKNGAAIGIGVFVIMLGVILLICTGVMLPQAGGIDLARPETVNNVFDALVILPLFVCIAIGVAIFIIFGTKMEKYKFLETKAISLSASTRNYVISCKQKFQTTYTITVTLGVVLCILSPVVLITMVAVFGESDLAAVASVASLLLMIAVAVFLFIRFGTEMTAYKQLLQEDDYTPERKDGYKKSEKIGAIYWPVVTAGYLAWSFITMDWHITWIVWPVAGALYGAIAAIFGAFSRESNTK